jgi:hypothetical protein
LDVGPQDAAGGAAVQIHLGADVAGDAGDLVQRQGVKVVALAGQGDEQILLAWFAVRATVGPVWRVGGRQGLRLR